MADKTQNAWVTRVLAVHIGVASEGDGSGIKSGGGSLKDAIARFRAASEDVDAQIASLQQALRASDDEELRDIGEYGLNAVTGNFRVPLMAALMGAEQGDPQARAKLADAATSLRNHLENDEKVEACDENPFGVAVSIRATLVPVLNQLAQGVTN
jgi:hypothetical protein